MPWIVSEWRDRLHAYLGGIVKGIGGTPLAIGGTADHVHLLVGTKSSHRLDYFLRDLKAALQNGFIAKSVSRHLLGRKGTARFQSVSQILRPFGNTS